MSKMFVFESRQKYFGREERSRAAIDLDEYIDFRLHTCSDTEGVWSYDLVGTYSMPGEGRKDTRLAYWTPEYHEEALLAFDELIKRKQQGTEAAPCIEPDQALKWLSTKDGHYPERPSFLVLARGPTHYGNALAAYDTAAKEWAVQPFCTPWYTTRNGISHWAQMRDIDGS